MISSLPEKLNDAESQIKTSLLDYLNKKQSNRISIDIRFEGLRLLPISIRMCHILMENNYHPILLFSDAGSTALAKRDAPELTNNIKSFKDIKNSDPGQYTDNVLIAVSPQPYDYEEYVSVCNDLRGIIIMINGKLDDSEVGIGSVARQRRKDFVTKWTNIYWIQPLKNAALMHAYPSDWILFKQLNNSYTICQEFPERPDADSIFEAILESRI